MTTKYIVHRRLNYANLLSAKIENSFIEWAGYPSNIKLNYSHSRKNRVVTCRLEMINEPDFVEWGMLLGLLAHTLRSTLDNIIYALSSQKTNKNQFPIFTDKQRYNESVGTYLSGISNTTLLSYIEQKQPFNASEERNHPLRLLQELNNSDKHRIPKFIVIRPKEFELQLSVEFSNEEDTCEPAVKFNEQPIRDGQWVVKYQFSRAFNKLTDNSEMRFQGVVEIDGRHYSIKEVCSELLKEVFEIAQTLGNFLPEND